MIVRAASHHYDTELAGGRRTRTVRNWANRRTPGGLWLPSNPQAVDEPAAPPLDWAGAWDMRFKIEDCPLQAYGFDTSDAANTTLVGCRLSDRPHLWLNWKAVGGPPVAPVGDFPSRTITWPDLYPGADLSWSAPGHRLDHLITIRERTAPLEYGLSLRMAPGMTCELVDQSYLLFRDAQGVEVMRTRPVSAWDSSPDGPMGRGKPVRVRLEERAPVTVRGRQLRTFWKVLDAADFAAATLPVMTDLTATISGTTDITDNPITGGDTSFNYGGHFNFAVGNESGRIWRVLIKIATSSIPAGSITAFRAKIWRLSNGAAANAGTLNAYILASARPFNEGNSVGVAEIGASCWSHYVWNTSAWTTAGLGSGTDYVADASPPTMAYAGYTVGADALYTFTLRASHASDWRDGVATNNGMICRAANEATVDNMFNGRAVEHGTNPVTFEIDYTVGALPLLVLSVVD